MACWSGLGIEVVAERPVGEHLLDHPILGLTLELRPDAQVSTLAHRHTNCCLRYTSGLAGSGVNDMIMIAGNLRPAEDGGTTRARIAVSAFQAFSEGSVRITTRDPAIDPRVDERMLSHDSDLLRMRDGVRRLREIGLHEDVRAIASRVEYGMTGRSIEAAVLGRRSSTTGCSPSAPTPSTPAAPAAWAPPTTRARWSIPTAG